MARMGWEMNVLANFLVEEGGGGGTGIGFRVACQTGNLKGMGKSTVLQSPPGQPLISDPVEATSQ